MTIILILQVVYGNLRDEMTNNADVSNDNAASFKYKANLIGNTEANGTKNGVKIAVPLKYLSNFWRSLEMPLINCKVDFSLSWIENCVLTSAAFGTMLIILVQIVQLSK